MISSSGRLAFSSMKSANLPGPIVLMMPAFFGHPSEYSSLQRYCALSAPAVARASLAVLPAISTVHRGALWHLGVMYFYPGGTVKMGPGFFLVEDSATQFECREHC